MDGGLVVLLPLLITMMSCICAALDRLQSTRSIIPCTLWADLPKREGSAGELGHHHTLLLLQAHPGHLLGLCLCFLRAETVLEN